ncbi:acetyl/propionyl/methylcrotonyl-CoA carboxylase subunit alpha [Nocardioides acrostichi]|uniref:ATP-grasp domain-containing protein n=1 Tax=Nocardioides acrostichi TaxID=2784339 RepID=A0A930YC51_9ACTN|nr:biotin carboxylase N-terminal domain-containing protein [Nocardioides acrostichi]MBF4161139.1 ATP-grasp domain-containing protein [Nocardioides acrostichi]
MITRLLVANRAEIASRVFRTCRQLGIATVAVHSDADADLPYVAEADTAVRLPGHAPAETYLRADLIVDAARRAGADAIHPGYGFLSENADFARAVIDAGLIWVGPAPEAIEQMGSKIGAKTLMRAAGVPVLEAPEQPTEADLPLIVKASAGGGGRGMRIVRTLAELDGEIAIARSEAASAFGDGTVFVEPYVERGRHVEVQVVGTPAGALVFGERDCSLQRRHQKVVEEAPAPALPQPTREALHAAARAAAEAIDYRGAGTVEFLYDEAADRFYFLEMNTRLQVEHPVTEAVHGVDLVALQVAVAEGETPVVEAGGPGSGSTHGHAIEVRLYAEDPAADYQPQSGALTTFEIPGTSGEEPGVRVDTGFASGTAVSTFYDAMLAKVVVHAPTRAAAARQLAGVLKRARIHGLVTNRDQLVSVLTDPEFLAGRVSTAFLADRAPEPTTLIDAPLAAALAIAERAGAARTVQRRLPVAWRNVVSQPQTTTFALGAEEVTAVWLGGRDGYACDDVAVLAASPTAVTLARDGVATTYDCAVTGLPGRETVDVDAPTGHVRLVRVPRFLDPADQVATGSLLAPMPGSVVQVLVEQGAEVSAGQPVVVLEAMKMQHTITAPADGVVSELACQAGVQVASGEVLAVVS